MAALAVDYQEFLASAHFEDFRNDEINETGELLIQILIRNYSRNRSGGGGRVAETSGRRALHPYQPGRSARKRNSPKGKEEVRQLLNMELLRHGVDGTIVTTTIKSAGDVRRSGFKSSKRRRRAKSESARREGGSAKRKRREFAMKSARRRKRTTACAARRKRSLLSSSLCCALERSVLCLLFLTYVGTPVGPLPDVLCVR